MNQKNSTFQDLVGRRQSTRKFTDQEVDIVNIKKCIEAARLAPSACNSQPWKFHVISEPVLRQKIAESTLQKGIALNRFALETPVLVVVTASKGNLKTKVGQMISGLPYYLIDVGIAAEHFCLQAAEVGLGTCMIGWFKEKIIKAELKLNSADRVALVIAVGYPSDSVVRKKARKDLDEITLVYD